MYSCSYQVINKRVNKPDIVLRRPTTPGAATTVGGKSPIGTGMGEGERGKCNFGVSRSDGFAVWGKKKKIISYYYITVVVVVVKISRIISNNIILCV